MNEGGGGGGDSKQAIIVQFRVTMTIAVLLREPEIDFRRRTGFKVGGQAKLCARVL